MADQKVCTLSRGLVNYLSEFQVARKKKPCLLLPRTYRTLQLYGPQEHRTDWHGRRL